jgi:hypothetical protein
MNALQIKLVTLREYTSRNGKPYLRGYLAGAKVLVVRDDRAELPDGCVAIWNLFLEQADEWPPRALPWW